MATSTHRYVPQGSASLASDAPGWSADASKAQTKACASATQEQRESESKGPVCWKCKGACTLKLRAQDRKKQKTGESLSQEPVVRSNAVDEKEDKRSCPVCNGKGYLPVRSRYTNAMNESDNNGGSITARRRRPKDWRDFGHVPPAVEACISLTNNNVTEKELPYALSFLHQANGLDTDISPRKDVQIKNIPSDTESIPAWLPIHPGDQLCNLVGRWRILQKIGSHRWTTDDIVTAWVAATSLIQVKNNIREGPPVTYLDLGTGNGSVLQMVTWYILTQDCDIRAFGVEARSEAVGLARRSLNFNLGKCEVEGKTYHGSRISRDGGRTGPGWHSVAVVNGDFRDLFSLANEKDLSESSDGMKEIEQVASIRYDLITGTPPYFRVDFSTDGSKVTGTEDEVVTSAVINQGGMPTSLQSAPARCEFRGGVEAYCETAAALLAPDGVFAVCENWLNNDRVWKGAECAGLDIIKVWPVKGKHGKDTLFAVYVMMKKESTKKPRALCDERKIENDIVVRDENGKWTGQYASIMYHMCIPPTSA